MAEPHIRVLVAGHQYTVTEHLRDFEYIGYIPEKSYMLCAGVCAPKNTHITAATLSRWISELPIKPMHIIFILDCKSAGNIATALVHLSARNCEYPDNLYVISACGNDENSITLSTLGHSIFTYITSHIFHTIPQNDHRSIIPLKEICADIISCCAALSSL